MSQTKDGIRLAMVGQGGDAAGASGDAVTLSPEAQADAAANRPAIAAAKNVLTPLERAAVSSAAQAAATEQDSLAPLFANLGARGFASNLPPKLQRRLRRCWRSRPASIKISTAATSRRRSRNPGCFSRHRWRRDRSASGVPDLKAALIVLRQTLQSALGAQCPAASAAGRRTQAAHAPAAAAACAIAVGHPDVQEIVLPQARPPVAEIVDAAGQPSAIRSRQLDAGPRPARRLNLLQEALQELGNPARRAAPPKDARGADSPFHTNTPPPPFRGAPPAAQPVASPSIAAACAARDHRASSARRHRCRHRAADLAAGGVAAGPRRYFGAEGSTDGAALEFRNSVRDAAGHRDGAVRDFARRRRQEVEAAKRMWRARFSLDVEPAGPVHALVSLSGEKTSVRMWAERPATAAQLRAGASAARARR